MIKESNSSEVKENEPVKISDITAALSDYTAYTIKKDVKYLLDEKLVKKLGKGRGTVYVVNEKG